MKKLRLAATALIVVATATLLLAWPLPYRIHCRLYVEPGRSKTVYVDVPGQLQQSNVVLGQTVRAGQQLAVLRNPEMESQISQLDAERQSLEIHLQSLKQRAYHDPSALAELEETDERLASLQRRLARRREQLQHLVLTAPGAGVVYRSPRPDAARPSGALPFWTGEPLLAENEGAFLDAGVPFCLVGCPTRGEAIIDIDEDWIEFIQPGQPVDILLTHWPDRKLHSRIRELAHTDSQSVEAAGSEPGGSARKGRGVERRPTRVYRARVPIEVASGRLLVHGTGIARIDVGRRSLGRRCWDSLQRTFRWEW